MKILMITYRLSIFLLLLSMLQSCASENREASKAFAPSENEFSSQDAFMDEEAAIEEVETVGNISKVKKENSPNNTSSKKWKRKAKQQLETILDLKLILNDTNIDDDFKSEIENELSKLYQEDTTNNKLKWDESLNFKHFKQVNNKANDTLYFEFKNKKELWKAIFTITDKTKQFGTTSETVQNLQLIAISKAN